MINVNGTLAQPENTTITYENRGLKFGDSVFETIKANNGNLQFFEDHYFRLMASMRMLRMEIPMHFTLEYLEQQIQDTLKVNSQENKTVRVRVTVYRKDGGLYTPTTNNIDFIIDTKAINYVQKTPYTLDIFKDHYVYSGLLSTIKTNNKIVNVLGSIFASENALNNCILVNEHKNVVEVLNGNIFLIKGDKIVTPAVSEGCLKGIMRKKLIEFFTKNANYEVEETKISPFELQKADEVFITNSIIGIQSVTNYRRKVYSTTKTQKISTLFQLAQS